MNRMDKWVLIIAIAELFWLLIVGPYFISGKPYLLFLSGIAFITLLMLPAMIKPLYDWLHKE